jgi:hypothetical protein
MTDATFEKLDPSEQPLYGPRRLILCGFDAAARSDFEKLIRVAEIGTLDCHWAGEIEGHIELKTLFKQPLNESQDPGPMPKTTAHPRSIVAGGLKQTEFHRLMNLSREVGMPATLWAVLTPVSETWTLNALLGELAAERAAMEARRQQAPQ